MMNRLDVILIKNYSILKIFVCPYMHICMYYMPYIRLIYYIHTYTCVDAHEYIVHYKSEEKIKL